MDSRKQFEKWAESGGMRIDYWDGTTGYMMTETRRLWEAWQASREAVEEDLAKAYEDGYRYRQERNHAETELELLKAKHNPFHGLWQDAEGTIPVTAAGQRVGRTGSPEGEVMVQRFAANRPIVTADGDVLLNDKTEWMESE